MLKNDKIKEMVHVVDKNTRFDIVMDVNRVCSILYDNGYRLEREVVDTIAERIKDMIINEPSKEHADLGPNFELGYLQAIKDMLKTVTEKESIDAWLEKT